MDPRRTIHVETFVIPNLLCTLSMLLILHSYHTRIRTVVRRDTEPRQRHMKVEGSTHTRADNGWLVVNEDSIAVCSNGRIPVFHPGSAGSIPATVISVKLNGRAAVCSTAGSRFDSGL